MPLYFIAIVAPESINRQVLEWKNYMREGFGCKAALRSPAHVTLIPPFNMPHDREEEMEELLRQFASSQSSFPITLNGFDSFRPRVIYVHVQPNTELERLKTTLQDILFSKGGFLIKKDSRPFHPHVTIANRDLPRQDFPAAWEYFREMKYEAQFEADAICLLRSGAGGWEIIVRAPMH